MKDFTHTVYQWETFHHRIRSQAVRNYFDLQTHHVQFTPQRLDQIKQETTQDTELKPSIETIVTGWSEKKRDVPK